MISNHDLIRIAGYLPQSCDDGPGMRGVLFLQGCSRHCPGCHNAQTHGPDGGHLLRIATIVETMQRHCRNRRLTISGGEPLEQLPALLALLQALAKDGFDLCLYTGWEVERVPPAVLPYLAYVKAGPFIVALRRPELQYVGSANQGFYRVVHGASETLVPLDIGLAA